MLKICDHTSVGMIVQKDGKILLIERANFPKGFACPAGHVDGDETYEISATRELKEEVGLDTTDLQLLIDKRKENPCKREGGTWHHWKIYKTEAAGDVVRSLDETKKAGWYFIDEIKALAEKTLTNWSFTYVCFDKMSRWENNRIKQANSMNIKASLLQKTEAEPPCEITYKIIVTNVLNFEPRIIQFCRYAFFGVPSEMPDILINWRVNFRPGRHKQTKKTFSIIQQFMVCRKFTGIILYVFKHINTYNGIPILFLNIINRALNQTLIR
jgi:ADP-ribose pyrophosphatase YjhB (NUDIX family)